MQKNYIVIAVLIAVSLAAIVFIASCTGSECTPEKMKTNSVTKAPTVDDCINLCHSYGLGWKAQIIGQDPGRGLLDCNCYVC